MRKARTTVVKLCCLAKCMLGTNDDPSNEERSDYIGEKWIADSGACFHMTHSAGLLSDVRLVFSIMTVSCRFGLSA